MENLSEKILLCEKESLEVDEPKLDELEKWKKNKVYTKVDNEGQVITSVSFQRRLRKVFQKLKPG